MAEGSASNVTGKEAEELEKEITCPVCQDHFTDPKILPCLHFYCKKCITDLATVTVRCRPHQPSFPCPECRADTILPGNNVDRLPTAFFMNRMVAVVERMVKVEEKNDFKCEMCLTGKVEAFCRQCTEFVCSECSKQHQRMKAKFPNHKISSLEELRKSGVKNIPTTVSPRTCEVHNEQKKLYCYDCKVLICRDCTLVDHAGHKYDFVVKNVPQVKASLHNYLVPFRGHIRNITKAVKTITDTKAQAVKQGATVDAEIKQYCRELHQLIEKRENELLEMSKALVQKNVETLTTQEKSLASSAAVVQDLVEFVDRTLENATDEELMEISDPILKRVKEENMKQASLKLKPVEVPNVVARLEGKSVVADMLQKKVAIYSTVFEHYTRSSIADGLQSMMAERSKSAAYSVSQFTGPKKQASQRKC